MCCSILASCDTTRYYRPASAIDPLPTIIPAGLDHTTVPTPDTWKLEHTLQHCEGGVALMLQSGVWCNVGRNKGRRGGGESAPFGSHSVCQPIHINSRMSQKSMPPQKKPSRHTFCSKSPHLTWTETHKRKRLLSCHRSGDPITAKQGLI